MKIEKIEIKVDTKMTINEKITFIGLILCCIICVAMIYKMEQQDRAVGVILTGLIIYLTMDYYYTLQRIKLHRASEESLLKTIIDKQEKINKLEEEIEKIKK